MRNQTGKGRRGNSVGRVVPAGYYTTANVAAYVGRSIDTVKRWRDTEILVPKRRERIYGENVWLYSEEEREIAKKLAASQKRNLKNRLPKSA